MHDADASERLPLMPETLLWAYSRGVFPMADSRHGRVDWYLPDPRAVLPLDRFKMSRSLRQRIKRGDYVVTRDKAFREVIEACAEPRPYAEETWINDEIIDAYSELHDLGLAHSVEAWRRREDGSHHGASEPAQPGSDHASRDAFELVGGLYGLAMGGAFFGESMFSRASDASKVCLAHLVDHLRSRGFILLDVQINSDHMAQFGTIEIGHDQYMEVLREALELDASWA